MPLALDNWAMVCIRNICMSDFQVYNPTIWGGGRGGEVGWGEKGRMKHGRTDGRMSEQHGTTSGCFRIFLVFFKTLT